MGVGEGKNHITSQLFIQVAVWSNWFTYGIISHACRRTCQNGCKQFMNKSNTNTRTEAGANLTCLLARFVLPKCKTVPANLKIRALMNCHCCQLG